MTRVPSFKKILKVSIVLGLPFIIGIGLGFALSGFNIELGWLPSSYFATSGCTTNYKFVNPEPDCETYEAHSQKLDALDAVLEQKVKQYLDIGKATRISVWSRDLVTLRWVAVNEQEQYAPASLLKLPLAIAYYKFSELDPTVLSQEITYDGTTDYNAEENIKPSHQIEAGKSYTVEELIEYMIKYSDNNATDLLFSAMKPDFFEKVSLDIGIKIPRTNKMIRDFITVKSYANVFRILYNSSYLSRENSEKILSILAESDFKDGARAELPSSISIAEKFGERATPAPSNDGSIVQEFHECGIVYAKQGPYSFCFMTEGRNLQDLESVASDLSKTIYDSADGEGKK